MFTPILDSGSSRPLYEQLYRYIRDEIEGGRLRAGERLPSKRALATHLKISVVTVEGAYGQLLAEGYLRSEPKRGFFVQAVQEEHRPALSPLPPAEPPQAKPSLPYDFSTSGVDTGLFAFSTWAKLMREVLSARADSLLASSHPQGVPELRRAIAEHLYRFRGIRAAPEQIVVCWARRRCSPFWCSCWAGTGDTAWRIPATPSPTGSSPAAAPWCGPSPWTNRACGWMCCRSGRCGWCM